MYKNKEIILFAFASKDLSNSAKRLKIQAKETKYYDQIRILSPDDFDKDMQEIYQEILSTRSNRGYGYWFWKPFFLKTTFCKLLVGLRTSFIFENYFSENIFFCLFQQFD